MRVPAIRTIALTSLLAVFGSGGAPSAAQSLDELRTIYKWGGVYVTGSTLVDLHNLSLARIGDQLSGLTQVFHFASQVGRSNISANIALLYVDLDDLEAGYITPAGNIGTLAPLPWTPDQVETAARDLHRYFTSNSRVVRAVRQVAGALEGNEAQAGDLATSVGEALEALEQARDDPYVSPVTEFRLILSVRSLVLAHRETLRAQLPGPSYQVLIDLQTRFDQANLKLDTPLLLDRGLFPESEDPTLNWSDDIELSLPVQLEAIERVLQATRNEPIGG